MTLEKSFLARATLSLFSLLYFQSCNREIRVPTIDLTPPKVALMKYTDTDLVGVTASSAPVLIDLGGQANLNLFAIGTDFNGGVEAVSITGSYSYYYSDFATGLQSTGGSLLISEEKDSPSFLGRGNTTISLMHALDFTPSQAPNSNEVFDMVVGSVSASARNLHRATVRTSQMTFYYYLGPKELRVATFNMKGREYFISGKVVDERKLEPVCSNLSEVDIVLLQETFEPLLTSISRSTSLKYYAFSQVYSNGEGNGIMSKFPIQNRTDIRPGIEKTTFILTEISIDGLPHSFICSHFRFDNKAARIAASEYLVNIILPNIHCPLVFGGDLNGDDTRSYIVAIHEKLKDACNKEIPNMCTNCAPTYRKDYIFFRGPDTVKTYSCQYAESLSDHPLIVAELVRRPPSR